MNILYVNKFFHLVGGVERYFLELDRLMRKKGHHTSLFYMQHPSNNRSKWQKHSVSQISFHDPGLTKRWRQLARLFYSIEARSKITALIEETSPDIVHLHTIYHHLSPSIILAVKKRNLPLIQNLGDYHLVSANYNLFHNGAICEISQGGKFYKAFFHRCVKNSYYYSLVETAEKYLQALLGWEKGLVDLFIVPSLFMKNKLLEYGLPENKITCLPHFIDTRKYKYSGRQGSYLLYSGRLSEEKGLRFLLEVMKELPQIKLKIAGTGPEEENLKNFVREHKLKNVTFLGFLEGQNLIKTIAGSLAVIVPSLWPEVFGMSVLEAYSLGKPVIAADSGALPELVKDNRTGFLFKTADKQDILEKIKFLLNQPALIKKMGKEALKIADADYSPEGHYLKIMKIYGNFANTEKF